MTGKVLVTGGSGFLGINLIRHLLAKGYVVRSLDILPFEYPEKDQIEEIVGDIRDKPVVKKAVWGVEAVVHCAAALPLYTQEDIYSTDIEGTKNLLAEAKKQEVSRFVHISSTAVYGIPDHHPLYEDDELQGVGPYGESKVEAEKVAEGYREGGMCVPILRPKSFVGPERLGVFALLYDWARTGHDFPVVGSGDNRYQLLDVHDLCEVIERCLVLSKTKVNDTFNIGAKQFTTLKEDYQVVLDEAGLGKKIIPLPEMPIIWTLRALDRLGWSPLYRWVYETVSKDSFVSIAKAEKKLEYKPKFSNKEALIRNYRWYVENLDKFEGESGVSHRVPWKQGVLGLVKLVF